jgi:hypothetical protein
MTSRRRSSITITILAGMTWILLDACGGRTLIDDPRADDGGPAGPTTGAGGASSSSVGSGGAGGRSGPTTTTTSVSSTGSGGVTTSAVGTGGSSISTGTGAGGSMCTNVGCPAIGCGPGYISVIEPGACCPVCKPAPCNGACVAIACPKGAHLETPPGMCCPICVPDGPTACEQGQKAYAELRSMLLQKYQTLGCMRDADCGTVYESNRCASSCGTALPFAALSFFADNLRSFADSNCASCPPQPPPPCVPGFVTCQKGQCFFGGPR